MHIGFVLITGNNLISPFPSFKSCNLPSWEEKYQSCSQDTFFFIHSHKDIVQNIVRFSIYAGMGNSLQCTCFFLKEASHWYIFAGRDLSSPITWGHLQEKNNYERTHSNIQAHCSSFLYIEWLFKDAQNVKFIDHLQLHLKTFIQQNIPTSKTSKKDGMSGWIRYPVIFFNM